MFIFMLLKISQDSIMFWNIYLIGYFILYSYISCILPVKIEKCFESKLRFYVSNKMAKSLRWKLRCFSFPINSVFWRVCYILSSLSFSPFFSPSKKQLRYITRSLLRSNWFFQEANTRKIFPLLSQQLNFYREVWN